MQSIKWTQIANLYSKQFTCGYCGSPIASDKGFCGLDPSTNFIAANIYTCHFCTRPNFFDIDKKQYPAPMFGKPVSNLPDDINKLYNEARSTVFIAPTGSALCSRKLLMNIAVSKGAQEGLTFIEYIEYLVAKRYVPPDGDSWVDKIRKTGNEATHKIRIITINEAEELVEFLEMLLKLIYEYPARANKRQLP